jgi:hypothetical protein
MEVPQKSSQYGSSSKNWKQGEWGEREGAGGEMAQTMYAQMNK